MGFFMRKNTYFFNKSSFIKKYRCLDGRRERERESEGVWMEQFLASKKTRNSRGEREREREDRSCFIGQ